MAPRMLLGKTHVPTIKALVVILGIVAGFGFVSTGTGCGAALGTDCTLTSDCDPNLYCVYGMCVKQCESSVDCNQLAMDAICVRIPGEDVESDDVQMQDPINLCQKPTACGENADGGTCGSGQTCAMGKCWVSCDDESDCPGSDYCKNGICLPNEDDAGATDDIKDEGKPCEINSDCATMLCGSKGFCRACRVSGDCFSGAFCFEGNCVGLNGYHGEGPQNNSSSSGWPGNDGVYTTCDECTHVNTGAYKHQCETKTLACLGDITGDCAKILNCSLNCNTNTDGGDCTVACITETYPYSTTESKELFYALDSCVYCQTCKSLCTDPNSGPSNPLDAAGYCSVICQQPGSVCE